MLLTAPKNRRQNLEFRKRLRERAHQSGALRKEIIERCRKDPVFFIDTFLMTQEPRSQQLDPLITWKSQEKAVRKLVEKIGGGKKGRAGGSRDVAVKKSRDQGGTLIVLAVILWFWLFHPNSHILLASRNEKSVDEPGNPRALFSKLEYFLDRLPAFLRPVGFDSRVHRRKLKLINPALKCTITGEGTTANIGKGDRRLCVVIDELPAFETIAQGRLAVRSAEATTDCRILIGTFDGAVGAFPEAIDRLEGTDGVVTLAWWDRPEHREGLYASKDGQLILLDVPYWERQLGRQFTGAQVSHRFPNAPDAEEPFEGIVVSAPPAGYEFMLDGRLRSPFYDEKWRRHNGDVRIMAEEYDMLPMQAGGMYFSEEVIDRHLANARDPVTSGELVVTDRDHASTWEFRPQSVKKDLRFWCHLVGDLPPPGNYSIGADISFGTGASNTCFSVVSKLTGEKVAEWTSSRVPPYEAAAIYVALARMFYDALLVPEYNGPGIDLTKRCLALGYFKFYCREKETGFANESTDQPGWHPNQGKGPLLSEYQHALGEGKFTNHSREALEEMRAFVHGERRNEPVHNAENTTDDPSGAAAAHGDRVIADALAWRGLVHVPMPTNLDLIGAPAWNTLAARRQIHAMAAHGKEYSYAL